MRKSYDVLIVDDDQNMRLTLAEILAEDGYAVLTASTGEEAVEICSEHTFRLVLMDVRMPGIDGVEAFRQIRQHCIRSQIVLMSAYSNPELETTAIDEGVLAFMPKPVEIEAINKIIAEVTSTAVLYVGMASDATKRLVHRVGEHGFQASICESIPGAVHLLTQINYDVLMMDIDGLNDVPASELGKFVSSIGVLPVILIAATELISENPFANAFESQIIGRLRHPIESDAVLALLESIKRKRLGVPPPG